MANCNHSDNLFWNLCFYFEMSKTLWVFRSPLSSEVQSTWIPNNQAEVMTWGWSSCLRLCGFPPRQLPLWAAFRSWKTCNAPYTLAYLSWEMNFPQLYISNQLCCGRGWAKVISAPWERDSNQEEFGVIFKIRTGPVVETTPQVVESFYIVKL